MLLNLLKLLCCQLAGLQQDRIRHPDLTHIMHGTSHENRPNEGIIPTHLASDEVRVYTHAADVVPRRFIPVLCRCPQSVATLTIGLFHMCVGLSQLLNGLIQAARPDLYEPLQTFAICPVLHAHPAGS